MKQTKYLIKKYKNKDGKIIKLEEEEPSETTEEIEERKTS